MCQHSTVRCLWQAHITFYCACAQSSDGSFSVEKQSAKYNLCRAVAIIADIKLMEKNNDMRLRAFICYGLNVQSLHRWMQVLRQNEVRRNSQQQPGEVGGATLCVRNSLRRRHKTVCVQVLARKFFEGWSFVQSDHSMTELIEVGWLGVLRFHGLVCTAATLVAASD